MAALEIINSAYLAILGVTSARFLMHTGVLAIPIPKKHYFLAPLKGKILIQYPIRNEPISIVRRFLKTLETIPKSHRHLFTLQILDDYNGRVAPYPKPCIDTQYLKRPVRKGNKAGNLNYGLANAGPEYKYVMIFDSDHQVDGSFFKQAAQILESDDKLACVQSRWVMDNNEHTLLSYLQQQLIGLHIDREQTFKSAHNLWPIFNGAGAVWKRSVVEDNFGGFIEANPCEDTDLSGLVNARGYKILVIPEWSTKIDNVIGWSNYRKQQYRWAIGNGVQLQRHIRDPFGWGLKKLYWLSWNVGHLVAFSKYFINAYIGYKIVAGISFSTFESLALIPHILAWVASCLTWDNKFKLRGLLLYPLHYITEQAVLPWQIAGWFKGVIYWKQHHDFVVTKKK